MNPFRTYFKALTKEERKALSDAVGTSVAYLWQIAYEQRRCSASMAIEIEKATNKAVRVEDLLSDIDWAYIRSSAQSIADSPNGFTNGIATLDDVQGPLGGAVDPDKKV